MKIVVDLDTLSVDGKGEALRGLVFWQETVNGWLRRGCYATFELRRGFRQIPTGKYPELFEIVAPSPEMRDDINVTAFESKTLVAMWWWDGDGTLLIWVKGEPHAYLNSDCKCDYTWKEVKL